MTLRLESIKSWKLPDPWLLALAITAGLMLVATLFYPFGYDQAVFSTAGEMVLHGAVPYRDFLDTKPPLIFYIYSVAIWLFGHHEWSIRILDLLWWSGTSWYFYAILRRCFSAEISVASVALAVILYAGSGFWMTAQAESFAVLPSLLLVDMCMRALERSHHAMRYGSIAGSAAAVLFLLKFTLLFAAVGTVIFLFSFRELHVRAALNFSAVLFGTLFIVLGIALLWLWETSALPRFLEWMNWIRNYASIEPQQYSWPVALFLIFPWRIIYSMSLALFVFALWTLVRWVRYRNMPHEWRPILRLLVYIAVAQLFGLLLERKILFPYEYTRVLWTLVPFSAIGLLFVSQRTVTFGNSRSASIAIAFILAALLTSPLYRMFTQTFPWMSVAITGGDQATEVARRIPDYYAKEEQEVASYLRRNMERNDQLFLWGNDVGIYFFADRLPTTICLTATPLRTDATPEEWKRIVLHELDSKPPRFFIAEQGDARPYITGSSTDSYQAMAAWPDLESFLIDRYAIDTTIGHFAVYRRAD